jgi:hypothetical protein
MESYSGLPLSNGLCQPLRDTLVKATLFARPLLTPVAKNCADANTVYSRAECIFIPEHYLASKPAAGVGEAFSNVCPDEVPSKTTVHRP